MVRQLRGISGWTRTKYLVTKFVEEVKKRFGQSEYEDPVGKLSKLTQSCSMAQFRAKLVEGIPESMLIIFFVWGLKMEIRRDLLLAPPKILTDAMSKAHLFEERNNELRGMPARERFQSEPEVNKAYKSYTGALVPITPPKKV